MRQLLVPIKGLNCIYYLLLSLCFFCSAVAAVEIENTATLLINFNGLYNVHSTIKLSDGISHSATGASIRSSNWKNNSTEVTLPQGTYDLVIQQGAGVLIVDDVDCNSNSCSVNDLVATLTIHFAGLNSVHSSIHVADYLAGQASGEKISHKNWQTDEAVMTLLKQVVDIKIRKGDGNLIVDDVDCLSGTCSIDNITATMTVNFPDMSSIHTSVFVTDGNNNTLSGQKVTDKNWQSSQAVITVFRQLYDISVTKNTDTIIIDNVNCVSGTCEVIDLTAELTVNFPDINNVHTSVRSTDDIANQASGEEVTYKNWQNHQTQMTVFKKRYDLYLRNGSAFFVVDNVDCTSGECTVDEITAILTVDFPGLDNVHTSVYKPDQIPGSVSGDKVTKQNWQNEQAIINLFPGVYDVKIRKGDDFYIVDDVNCTAGSCAINDITALMSVKFPGLSAMHTSVYVADKQLGVISGAKLTDKNWQTNVADITVFKKQYDVSIRGQESTPIIKDQIDCRSGFCVIDDIVATMTVKFDGMSNVHTSVYQPDGNTSTANGAKFTDKNWQTDRAVMTVLKQSYDVSIKQGDSMAVIVDTVDCTSGRCTVDQLTATLIVNFQGMSSVHTSILVPDGTSNTATGAQVEHLNWQKNQAVFTVFKQYYDVSVRRFESEPMVVDNIDCTSGDCSVNDLTALLSVNFQGLNSVHTSVMIPDNTLGTASGALVSQLNWQKNQAVLTVLRQVYDLQVRKESASKIIDNVDCTSGICNVDELTAKLDISFPGLSSVHSSAYLPDNIDHLASGKKAAHSNWKTHQTSITLLRETYDIKVKHAVTSVFDNVDCNSANCQVLVTGNVQALLINGDINVALANKPLIAYEKLADGTLNKVMQGKTTDLGQVNFTLADIESGKVYVLKTSNPLGNGKTYFSGLVTAGGEYKFIVTKDGENELDLTPPTIRFTTPENAGNVPDIGFSVRGFANDNRAIDKVEFSVNDPIKGIQSLATTYDTTSKSWSVNVPTEMISANSNIVLTAVAFDLAQNQSTSSITVSVIEDDSGPDIVVTSHVDNDQVSATGFLLSGTVSDLTSVATLQASLIDSALGQTISNQNVDFSINEGIWTLVINSGLMSVDGAVDITLNASDAVGNSSSKTIHLLVVAVDYSNAHMLNRITFGASPSLLQEIDTLGALTYLSQQLAPKSIDDSAFEAILGNEPPSTKEALQTWTMMHMLHSQRQLLEVMTWFWDNHFNTNINTKRSNAQGIELSNTAAYELDENQLFRANALGNFADLLEISAKSPAMLIYLDNISNVAGDSNENYAREVDELHTMGVDGGYTDQDVENGAEIFTGWHVLNGEFFFDESFHSGGSYTLFAGTAQEITIDDGGVEQGEILLNALATHPSTANFICRKLIAVFVNDKAPESLLTRCANEFLAFNSADDQIERVLRLIMQSVEFNAVENYRSKIKTPLEFVIGTLRNLQATSDASDLASPIRSMGLRLYENPVPTGWSEIGADWINASLLIERIKWINYFVHQQPETASSTSAPLQFYPDNGFATADGIVGFLMQLTVGDDLTELGRNNALDTLGAEFDLSNPDADTLLRQLNGHVMSYPQYQFQ